MQLSLESNLCTELFQPKTHEDAKDNAGLMQNNSTRQSEIAKKEK